MLFSNMREKETAPKHAVRNDIILIISILLIAAIGLLYLFKFRSKGDTIKITVDGKTYGMYSLSENITEDIYSGNGNEHLNRLVIRDGKAYMEKATCPDGICVAHAPIFRDGESIVCLPQRVVITVITQDNADNPDIIV